jgi:histidinol-phosphate aminotransferase
MSGQLKQILAERDRLTAVLTQSPFYSKVYPSDANFILVEVGDADDVYQKLIDGGVVVRNRNNVTLCKGCLRITIGTPQENETLLNAMKHLII